MSEQETFNMLLQALEVLEEAKRHMHTIHANPGRDADFRAMHGLSAPCEVLAEIERVQSHARTFYARRRWSPQARSPRGQGKISLD